MRDVPVADALEVGRGADDGGGGAAARLVDQGVGLLPRGRRRRAAEPTSRPEGGHVAFGQRLEVGDHAGRGAAAGPDDDEVLAGAFQAVVELAAAPVAGRHEGDDGADADDDAQPGQGRAELVEQQRGQRQPQRGEGGHRTPRVGNGPIAGADGAGRRCERAGAIALVNPLVQWYTPRAMRVKAVYFGNLGGQRQAWQLLRECRPGERRSVHSPVRRLGSNESYRSHGSYGSYRATAG